MKPGYIVEHTEPEYKIPAVTGHHSATFDQQQYRMLDDEGRTVKHVRIIRDSTTRPMWRAQTDEPRWQDEVVIAERETLAECQARTIDFFTRIMQQG